MTQPTAGALRAATKIIIDLAYQLGLSNNKLAEIIDRETAQPIDLQEEIARLEESNGELLAALERGHLHFLQNNKLTVDDREMLDEMWASIKKAKP
jgi:hypothetical protein